MVAVLRKTMKIKDGFILRKIAGNYIVVGVGEAAAGFNAMISVNETGAFLWEKLSGEGATKEELLEALRTEYEVDEETAKKDITEFLKKLHGGNLLILED